MKNEKIDYYNILPLLEENALYNLIIGRRSNGKSYAVKYMFLWEAFWGCDYYTYMTTKEMVKKERYQMAYIRRYDVDIKTAVVESYFGDLPIKEITKGEYSTVCFYRGSIYFANVNDDTKKYERGKKIGEAFALTQAQHYKSLTYPYIGNLVLEEFIPEDGCYLSAEVNKLISIASTILRQDIGRVFMIANNVFPDSPYFNEWQLVHIDKQKPGTIDIYEQITDDFDEEGNNVTIKVAVEFIGDNVGKASKMFFGKAAQATQSSKWVCNEYHHLEKPLINYNIYYRILYRYNRFSFMICLLKDPTSKEPFVYIYPSDNERKVKRFITQDFSTDPLHTEYLTIVTKYDKLILEMINANKVCFSDNLTGTRFYSIKKERGTL